MATDNTNIQYQVTKYRDIEKYYHKDWAIEAYKISRNSIKDKEYKDLGITGHTIYFLYGEDNDDKIKVYIGRASETLNNIPLFTRLYQHKISTTEPYRDIWYSVIAINYKDLSFDEMRNLENYFFNNLLPEVRLNDKEPDTNHYKYEAIKHKVEYTKEYIKYILQENVFKDTKEKSNKAEASKLIYSEKELKNQGKRLVDKDFEVVTEIQTPNNLVESMLNLLPSSIWNPNTKFLDPACKSGEYLKAIFNRLMASDLYPKDIYPNDTIKTLHILDKQIYGIALTDQSLKLSQESLILCPNIIKIDNFSTILKCYANLDKLDKRAKIEESNKILNKLGITEKTIKEFISHKFKEENMKFDIVIGNPPYQQSTGAGNNGGKAIYDSFIYTSLELADRVCMIVKNNWMNSNTLKGLRTTILKNGLNTLVNYSLLGDVFPNMGIAASIIYMDKKHSGKLNYREIQKDKLINSYNEDIKGLEFIPCSVYEYSIAKKVKGNQTFEQNVIYNPFGIATNGTVDGYEIEQSTTKSSNYNIAIKYVDKVFYTNLNAFRKNSNLVKYYKVICPKQIHKTNNPIPSVFILKPDAICTSSYSIMYYSDDKDIAIHVSKYIKTKFFRFLTYCLADTLCGLTGYRVSLVPLQNFTPQSDIPWNQSISEIDKFLYKKYNLSPEEINYIESTIKSLDTERKPSEPKPSDEKPSDEKPTEPKTKDSKAPFTMHDVAANFINQQLKSQDTP